MIIFKIIDIISLYQRTHRREPKTSRGRRDTEDDEGGKAHCDCKQREKGGSRKVTALGDQHSLLGRPACKAELLQAAHVRPWRCHLIYCGPSRSPGGLAQLT